MTDAFRVLVLDDEKAIRESLSAHLEDDGFAPTVAESAEDALAAMERELPHAVIVDLRLPGMDGASFIFEAHSRWPAVVFAIYTGSSEYRMQTELMGLPCVSRRVFVKPLVDLTQLSMELRGLLAARDPSNAN